MSNTETNTTLEDLAKKEQSVYERVGSVLAGLDDKETFTLSGVVEEVNATLAPGGWADDREEDESACEELMNGMTDAWGEGEKNGGEVFALFLQLFPEDPATQEPTDEATKTSNADGVEGDPELPGTEEPVPMEVMTLLGAHEMKAAGNWGAPVPVEGSIGKDRFAVNVEADRVTVVLEREPGLQDRARAALSNNVARRTDAARAVLNGKRMKAAYDARLADLAAQENMAEAAIKALQDAVEAQADGNEKKYASAWEKAVVKQSGEKSAKDISKNQRVWSEAKCRSYEKLLAHAWKNEKALEAAQADLAEADKVHKKATKQAAGASRVRFTKRFGDDSVTVTGGK